MLLTIKKEQCILSHDGQRLITEASDTGLPPGIESMPIFIAVVDAKNEGFLFHLGELGMNEDEITGWNYFSRTRNNFGLLVIND